MKYYHIGIKLTSGELYTKYNLTDEEYIVQKYILPYKNSSEFIISGSKIKPFFVKTFFVIPTEETIESFVSNWNKDLPFSQYSRNDIFTYFKDYNAFDEFLEILDGKFSEKSKKNEQKSKPLKREKSVFIVHGHDEEMMKAAENFVIKIGYRPIILKDEVNQGKTIIEKIEEYSNVPYAIVLYSPCDKGYDVSKPDEIRCRARQNVVFEHGYLISRLSRKNVCALVKDGVEIPSDLSGIVFTPYKEGWEQAIVKEMKSLGFNVNEGWSSLWES